ncbi:MAG: hypothetical protein IPG04_28395 [Polyangiaceae bacterium]|jgi:hypothetical protein|nr:hypothetical protein [Polyangiaceae bacterium]
MRQYITFDPKKGYPAAPDIAYECTACGGVVSSMPTYDEPWMCTCRNVRVDGDAGRVSVDDHAKMKAFRRQAAS